MGSKVGGYFNMGFELVFWVAMLAGGGQISKSGGLLTEGSPWMRRIFGIGGLLSGGATAVTSGYETYRQGTIAYYEGQMAEIGPMLTQLEKNTELADTLRQNLVKLLDQTVQQMSGTLNSVYTAIQQVSTQLSSGI